jgi:tetratricopeptide (TPR) repeat protein
MRRVLGDEHPQTIAAMNNLTTYLQVQGKTAEAEALCRIALANMRRAMGDDHPDTIRIVYNLGFLLESQGRMADALPLQEEVYRRAPASSLPPKDVALFCSRYGPVLVKLGQYQEAEQPLRRAHEMLTTASLRGDRRMRVVTAALAEVCEKTGRPDEGARWRQQLAELDAATRTTTRRKGG